MMCCSACQNARIRRELLRVLRLNVQCFNSQGAVVFLCELLFAQVGITLVHAVFVKSYRQNICWKTPPKKYTPSKNMEELLNMVMGLKPECLLNLTCMCVSIFLKCIIISISHINSLRVRIIHTNSHG